ILPRAHQCTGPRRESNSPGDVPAPGKRSGRPEPVPETPWLRVALLVGAGRTTATPGSKLRCPPPPPTRRPGRKRYNRSQGGTARAWLPVSPMTPFSRASGPSANRGRLALLRVGLHEAAASNAPASPTERVPTLSALDRLSPPAPSAARRTRP